MKNKIVGLAAVTLVLAMCVGLVSGAGYTVGTSINVTRGFGFQFSSQVGSDIYKDGEVIIGNRYVNATCGDDPAGFWDAYDLVHYNKDLKGTGSVATIMRSSFDASHQYNTITFEQSVTGNRIFDNQLTDIPMMGNDYGYQDFIAATDGYMDLSFVDMSVKRCTFGTKPVTEATIHNSVTMEAQENNEISMLFNTVEALSLEPAIDLYQYAAAPDIDFGFSLTYVKPDC